MSVSESVLNYLNRNHKMYPLTRVVALFGADKNKRNRVYCSIRAVLVALVLVCPSQIYAGDSPVVVVGIQESSLDPVNIQSLLQNVQNENAASAREAIGLMQKSWPYPRSFYGCLVERLFELGAKTVAINIQFPTSREGDERFAEVLKKYPGRVVLASTKASLPQGGSSVVMPNKHLMEAVGPKYVGYAYLDPEQDGIVRRFSTHLSKQKEIKEIAPSEVDAQAKMSFASLAIEAFSGKQISPAVREIDFQNVSKETSESAVIPIEAVFIDRLLKKSPLDNGGRAFKDKLVFVGISAGAFHEAFKTKAGSVNAVEVHAQIARNLLNVNP